MPNDEMFNLICRDKFEKIDEQLSNHIPSLIRAQFWKFLGVLVPLFGTLLYFILRS